MGCARCSVKTVKAFTLIELLAVVGIMLLLMTGVFGVFGLLAQEAGPEAAVSTLQAMLNSARDYAASEVKDTRVVFSVDTTKGTDGTTMALQYLMDDGVTWDYVRGRKPFDFHGRIYICKGMPGGFPAPQDKNGNPLVLGDIDGWKWYGQMILTGPWPSSPDADTAQRGMSGVALDKNGNLKDAKPGPLNFGVIISPTGYWKSDIDASATVNGFTVIQVGGTRVVGYVFYPLNPNTGTRLLFE